MDISDIKLPSNRKFGFFFTTIFFIISAYFFINQFVKVSYLFSALSLILLFLTLIKADILLPLNSLWMKFGMLIGSVVSPIVLGVIYFGLFTPMSMIMKVIGRDELRLNLTDRKSYWKEKDSASLPTNISDKQY